MHSFLRSIAVCVLAATSAVAQTLPQPANHSVFFTGNAVDNAAADLVGAGITLPGNRATSKAKDHQGNEIVWREVRSGTDSRGARHAFYRQYLVNGDTATELVGSEVGVHYTPKGELSSISGHQFRDVVVANRRALDAARANERALVRLQNHPTFKVERAMSESDRLYRLANAQLKLVQAGNGNAFRYAWYTIARDVENVEHRVVIDAQSEDILAVVPMHMRFNCSPTTPYTSVSATGEPVRPELRNAGVRRSILANVANDRPSPYMREAFYQGTPYISLTQETDTDAFQCSNPTPTGRAYTLVPVDLVGGVATYRDSGEWRGYAAGDAMYNTKETMAALTALGRNGWDGNYGDSNIVLESTFLGNYFDGAFFRMTGNGDSRVPPTPFMGIVPTSRMYNPGASLDHIAHEWGHGVIFTSANFDFTQTVGNQMHEGWADVIGQIVEKRRQPTGSGYETSTDWTMHEDTAINGTYCRGAIDDDADGTPGHPWDGPWGSYTFNDAVHRQDNPGNQEAHDRGNMLNMVIRLLSDGGSNPICSREPTYGGCGTTMTGLGMTTATQIMFDTVTWYTPSTATWEDLPTYATEAAFDRYNTCYSEFKPLPASVQQSAVNKAFTAIGYPRLTGALTCF